MNIQWFKYKFSIGILMQVVLVIITMSILTFIAIEYLGLNLFWGFVLNIALQAIVLSTVIKMNILQPLRVIYIATQKIAQGDFSSRIDSHSSGETFELEQSINEMAVALETSIQSSSSLLFNLRKAVDASEKANQAKSVFLANISHELRTPMHGILSFARFGQQKIATADKDKLKTYFDEIYDSGSRLINLLNDLLDLAKLEAGKINYSMEENDLSMVAKSVIAELTAFAEEKKLKFEIKYTDFAKCIFDNLRMMQVFRNILNNAVKFSTPNTVIRIKFEQTEEFSTCRIINNGLGIPPEELGSVFDKFVQSSKTNTGAGGTGLGLAICKEIIDQHGGKIWAESELNVETSFIIEIPRNLKSTKIENHILAS